MPTYIDLTPTWGEWGNLFYLFASKGEVKQVEILHRDFALAMSAAAALNSITSDLTENQQKVVSAALAAEMKKQGFEL